MLPIYIDDSNGVAKAMNFTFTKISLPILITPKPFELLKILEQLKDSPINYNLLLQNIPDIDFSRLRNMDEIMGAIDDDLADSIHLLEWLYCVSYKGVWDTFHPSRSWSTSRKIWSMANHIKPLKHFLFWNLVLTYSGNENSKLTDSLVNSFQASTFKDLEDVRIINIINILTCESSSINIAKISQKYSLTPQDLFSSLKLPIYGIEPLTSAYNNIANLFINTNNPSSSQVQWLLDCLDQMSVKQEIEAVNKLLIAIGSEIVIHHPALVMWITTKYSQSNDNNYWFELSTDAREALRKWQGVVNYSDFQRMVDIVLGHSEIRFQDHERRRLQNRQVFWSNYTDRFEQIRILLPKSSFANVQNSLNTKDICILEDDGVETEICIFDFKDWLLVEFFRGEGSETRIFPKTIEIEKKLLQDKHLSASQIHNLGGEIHDHLKYWQHDCVKWLRKMDICPNEDITMFKITPYKKLVYNHDSGLPELSQDQKWERREKLTRWERSRH